MNSSLLSDNKDDASELCEQWLYDVAADDVSDTPQSATCFFNMDG